MPVEHLTCFLYLFQFLSVIAVEESNRMTGLFALFNVIFICHSLFHEKEKKERREKREKKKKNKKDNPNNNEKNK